MSDKNVKYVNNQQEGEDDGDLALPASGALERERFPERAVPEGRVNLSGTANDKWSNSPETDLPQRITDQLSFGSRDWDPSKFDRPWQQGAPLQPEPREWCRDGMAPIPMTCSRSSPVKQSFLSADGDSPDTINLEDASFILTRTFSTPAGLRTFRSRSASSAFCRSSSSGSAFTQPSSRQLCSRSDPGISAFNPVCSSKTLGDSTTSSVEPPDVLNYDGDTLKSKGTRRSKLFSGIKAMRKGRSRSGRENPARPNSSGDETPFHIFDEALRAPSPPSHNFSRSLSKEVKNTKDSTIDSCSSPSDNDDHIMPEPTVGQFQPLDMDEEETTPPTAQAPSPSCNDITIHSMSPAAFHPLADEHDTGTIGETDVDVELRARPKPKSPQRDQSPLDTPSVPHVVMRNNNPSSPSSPDSRLSSAHSRVASASGTVQTEASLVDADYEVREANGKASVRKDVEIDGNGTVFSSSTSSSNFNAYINSPRPLRDGATLPVERFFAGGNVTMSPRTDEAYENEDAEATISKFSSLTPKKARRDLSPHTISSSSVSNTSSSGSDTKGPLKFVAYEPEARDTPAKIVDCARLKLGERSHRDPSTQSTIIKPRISKGLDKRLARYRSHKPPLSPEKSDWTRGVGCRTPTRTPPDTFSGANTPCSPPVIVDDPGVLYDDMGRSETTRPSVVRSTSTGSVVPSSSKGKMFLIPPSSLASIRPHPPVALTSTMHDVVTVVGRSSHDGAQEVYTARPHTISPEKRRLFGDNADPVIRGLLHSHPNRHPSVKKGLDEAQAALVTPEKEV